MDENRGWSSLYDPILLAWLQMPKIPKIEAKDRQKGRQWEEAHNSPTVQQVREADQEGIEDDAQVSPATFERGEGQAVEKTTTADEAWRPDSPEYELEQA